MQNNQIKLPNSVCLCFLSSFSDVKYIESNVEHRLFSLWQWFCTFVIAQQHTISPSSDCLQHEGILNNVLFIFTIYTKAFYHPPSATEIMERKPGFRQWRLIKFSCTALIGLFWNVRWMHGNLLPIKIKSLFICNLINWYRSCFLIRLKKPFI